MSLAQQKAEQALAKSKAEINLKIKRADKNLKLLFGALKLVLEKPDDDQVFVEVPTKALIAKQDAQSGRFFTFMFDTFLLFAPDLEHKHNTPGLLNLASLSAFAKYMCKELSDN